MPFVPRHEILEKALGDMASKWQFDRWYDIAECLES